jgi:D-glycerate 3-kinase
MLIDPRILALVERAAAVAGAAQRVPLIGIGGAQGSGKSFLARALAARCGGVFLSLDDFYLTQSERKALAAQFHSLFTVRGVPGTHDLALLEQTITALRHASDADVTPLPAFDKLADERAVQADWHQFSGCPKMIIIEGWCLGATPISPHDLKTPINELERVHDPLGVWCQTWNNALTQLYQPIYDQFDAILHLVAPCFDVVLDWRGEQEEDLLGLSRGNLPYQRQLELKYFIAHFERLTRHMLARGVRATAQLFLDPARTIVAVD